MRKWVIGAAALLVAGTAIGQGAKRSSAVDADVLALKPGQYIWDGDIAPEGPMTVVVNLKTQRAYVYRNGVRIGASTVSSGKAGHRTPTGVFTILQKNKDHKSNLYNNAPMPYMQRLTWSGIAMHAGNLPGYPASHGCIRLPMEFSRQLFEASSMGMTVVVTDDAVEPQTASANAFLAPITPKGTPDDPAQRHLDKGEKWRWTPEKSPAGPVTIVLSTDSKRVIVYRNGIEIGQSRVRFDDAFQIATRALQYKGVGPDGAPQWLYMSLPGYETEKGQTVDPAALQKVHIPEDFVRLVYSVIGPGTTVLATSGGIVDGSSGRRATVIEADKPEKGAGKDGR